MSLVMVTTVSLANDLPKYLKCDSAPGSFHEQSMIRQFIFFVNPAGQAAVYYEQQGWPRYASYTIDGTTLKIGFPVDLTYDLTNPGLIQRKFKDCVSAAYGGDVECIDVLQTCVLE